MPTHISIEATYFQLEWSCDTCEETGIIYGASAGYLLLNIYYHSGFLVHNGHEVTTRLTGIETNVGDSDTERSNSMVSSGMDRNRELQIVSSRKENGTFTYDSGTRIESRRQAESTAKLPVWKTW